MIRRLIGDGKLAPRLKGQEKRIHRGDSECPICFLHYRYVNRTKCCQAVLCTECYLQVKPQKEKCSVCPFCNQSKFTVAPAEPLTNAELDERDRAETIGATATSTTSTKLYQPTSKHHLTNNKGEDQPEQPNRIHTTATSPSSSSTTGTTTTAAATPENHEIYETNGNDKESVSPSAHKGQTEQRPPVAFGSSLELNPRIALLRARSESLASSTDSNVDLPDITALAMTPDERRALEREMQAQSSHPLAQRLEREEAERRMRNELEYYRNLMRQRQQQQQHLRSMYSAIHRGGGGTSTTPSSVNGSRRSHNSRVNRELNRILYAFEHGEDMPETSLDDLMALEAALVLSVQEEDRRGMTDRGDERVGSTQVRAVSGRGAAADSDGNDNLDDAAAADDDNFHDPILATVQRARNRALYYQNRSSSSRSSRSRSALTMDPSSIFVRGLSEEEQLAMAIAASLEEQRQQQQEQQQQQQEEEVHQSIDTASTGADEPIVNETITTEGMNNTLEATSTVAVATESTTTNQSLRQEGIFLSSNDYSGSDHKESRSTLLPSALE